MTQEALKLALDALERYGNRHRATYLLDGAWDAEITLGDKAITAIKDALAQTQEPVALPCCGYTNPEAIKWNTHNQVVQCHNCGQVYTPQRQPLTQEQRDAIVRPAVPNDWNDYEVIDAVEAAHGIKE